MLYSLLKCDCVSSQTQQEIENKQLVVFSIKHKTIAEQCLRYKYSLELNNIVYSTYDARICSY